SCVLVWIKTKRPPGNQAASFQGRIVPTEVRLNPSELSGKNLMFARKAVSRNFSRINAFVFNELANSSTLCEKWQKMSPMRPFRGEEAGNQRRQRRETIYFHRDRPLLEAPVLADRKTTSTDSNPHTETLQKTRKVEVNGDVKSAEAAEP